MRCQAVIAEGGSEQDLRAASAQLATTIGSYKKVAKHAKKLKAASAKPKAKPAVPDEPITSVKPEM